MVLLCEYESVRKSHKASKIKARRKRNARRQNQLRKVSSCSSFDTYDSERIEDSKEEIKPKPVKYKTINYFNTLTKEEELKVERTWICLKGINNDDVGSHTNEGMIDLWELRLLALSPGGLVQPHLRAKAWPKLLGVESHRSQRSIKVHSLSEDEINLIRQDIGRSAWPLDQSLLQATISDTLMHSPVKLHYYQGYHDITSLLLMNLHSPSLTSATLSRMAVCNLKEYMRETLQTTTALIQISLTVLLNEMDEDLYNFFTSSEIHLQGIFVSWVIGLFSHDIHDFSLASKVIDVCSASHPSMPLYLSAAMLLVADHRDRILSSECDDSDIYMIIQDLPNTLADDNIIDEWFDIALHLIGKIPPQELTTRAQQLDDDDESLHLWLKIACSGESILSADSPPYSVAPTAPTSNENCYHESTSPSTIAARQSLHSEFEETKLPLLMLLSAKGRNLDIFRNMSYEYIKQHRRAFLAAGKGNEYREIMKIHRKSQKLRRFVLVSGIFAILLTSITIWTRTALSNIEERANYRAEETNTKPRLLETKKNIQEDDLKTCGLNQDLLSDSFRTALWECNDLLSRQNWQQGGKNEFIQVMARKE